MNELRYEIEIEADPEVIYRHLTEREGLLRWIASDAVADPVPGGALCWTHHNGAVMEGRFVELEPPTRVVFRYGWRDDLMGVPPESTTVEILLNHRGHRTVVTLIHRDLPPAAAPDHRRGWVHFLGQLADCLVNG